MNNTALYNFWESLTIQRGGKPQPKTSPAEWNEQVYTLSRHGRGIEESLNYILNNNPEFTAFTDWVEQGERPIETDLPDEPVLTQEDLDFWKTNGYIVVRNVVSEAQCTAAREAIWKYLDATPDNPDSWYRPHPGKKGLMVSFFQNTALNTNRSAQRIKMAYKQLYGDTPIYLHVDKVSFNPPQKHDYKFAGSPLHWDVSLKLPIPYVLQGLLYLTDTEPEDGAFHCVPGFHKQIDKWITGLPAGSNPRQIAISELKSIPVIGNAGDLVIWHQALPHCATPNKSKLPRMVQYITYLPVVSNTAEEWI